jgi:hypothetical protein
MTEKRYEPLYFAEGSHDDEYLFELCPKLYDPNLPMKAEKIQKLLDKTFPQGTKIVARIHHPFTYDDIPWDDIYNQVGEGFMTCVENGDMECSDSDLGIWMAEFTPSTMKKFKEALKPFIKLSKKSWKYPYGLHDEDLVIFTAGESFNEV